MSTPHRIRRQTWSLRAATATDAFTLRREVREAWEAVLLPAMEQAFDEAADGERVIRIPRLELRLRLDSPGELAAALPRLVREAIGAELRSPRGAGAGRRRGVTPAADRLATLRHYLRTGSLPWAAAGRPGEEVVAELRAAARAEWPRLLESLCREPELASYAFRLLQLLGEPLPEELATALPESVPPLWRRVVAALLAPPGAAGGAGLARHARLELAAALLAEALSRPVADLPAAVVQAAARRGGPEAGVMVECVLSPAPKAPRGRGEGRAEPGSGARPPARSRPPGRGGAGKARAQEGVPAPAGRGPDRPLREKGRAHEAVGVDAAAEEELGITVASAGLPLLHPFLAPLLGHTGLREGDAIPWRALPRAAALLHYLATGREEVLEMELGLVKLLLGLSPDAPLPVAEGLLGPPDREECEALLRAVVGHWSVLKSTSPEGLREAFLRRPGLLQHDAAGWTLRVQPAPFDLLLGHLPWSYSIVKLPWMPEPIHTEWATA